MHDMWKWKMSECKEYVKYTDGNVNETYKKQNENRMTHRKCNHLDIEFKNCIMCKQCKKNTIKVLSESNTHNVRINENMPCEIRREDRNEDTLCVRVDASVKNGIMVSHIEMRGYMIE